MTANKPTDGRPLEALREHGLLLLADKRLPSVASLVARQPISGSWWAHPAAQAIFDDANELADHADVLVCKLLSGKVTFVHRPIWPDVLAIATSRVAWQLDGLGSDALGLLSEVDERGTVDASGKAARELERRLLVHATQVHTERGSHSKILQSWQRWIANGHPLPNPALAQERLEQLVRALNSRFGGSARLPWAH